MKDQELFLTKEEKLIVKETQEEFENNKTTSLEDLEKELNLK
jgi:hypothetical protein